MNKTRALGALVGAILAAAAPAAAQDLSGNGEFLWNRMSQGHVSDGGYSRISHLVEDLVRDRNYVCEYLIQMVGFGPTNRGRYARVDCAGEGKHRYWYRLDLWADRSQFTVFPWDDAFDDNRG